MLGCKFHETDVKEVEIFLHHKSGSYGVHELDDTSEKKYNSGEVAAESLGSLQKILHYYPFMAESTTSWILAKIAPG